MRKRPKTDRKLRLMLFSVFCISLVLVLALLNLHRQHISNPAVDRSNWELFSDSETDISFLHPKNLTVLTTNNFGREYSVETPKHDVNYLYSVAEAKGLSTTFLLKIRADSY